MTQVDLRGCIVQYRENPLVAWCNSKITSWLHGATQGDFFGCMVQSREVQPRENSLFKWCNPGRHPWLHRATQGVILGCMVQSRENFLVAWCNTGRTPCLHGGIQEELLVYMVQHRESSLVAWCNTGRNPCLHGAIQWELIGCIVNMVRQYKCTTKLLTFQVSCSLFSAMGKILQNVTLIFIHLKLCLASAIHNFKWLKFTHNNSV